MAAASINQARNVSESISGGMAYQRRRRGAAAS